MSHGLSDLKARRWIISDDFRGCEWQCFKTIQFLVNINLQPECPRHLNKDIFMPKKVTSKVNIRCMWMLPYARYNLQSLNHFSIVIIPVVWTTRTYLVSEERATCWIADSLLGSLRKHLEKVQSRNTKSSRQMFSSRFFTMYFIGRFCTQSDVSRQSPVWSMVPNWPSNKNMTAPEITKKAKT